MEIGPILRAMLRNKIGALLIALQIAFTLIVCVNSFAMIEDRLALIDRPSGLVEDELFHLASTGIGANFNALVEVAGRPAHAAQYARYCECGAVERHTAERQRLVDGATSATWG